MKLSLPTRVPPSYLLSFSVAMLMVELVEGTPLWLALSAQAFIIVAGVAFNISGGLVYASGAFIFFNTVLSLGLGMVAKAVFGEPLQTNLLSPQRTILVYLAGMCSVLVAVAISTRLRSKRGLLERVDVSGTVTTTGLGCLAISIVMPLIIPKDLSGTYGQFNSAFLFVTIMLVVFLVTKQSDGRRSFHYVAFLSWIYLTAVYGILHFSKQGMFGPSVAWGVAALAGGYRTSLFKVAILSVCAVIALTLLTPFSQLARNYSGQDNATDMALQLLLHPLDTRDAYNEQSRLAYQTGVEYHWFNEPQGLLDRLTMFPIDDALVFSTDNRRPGTPYALWTYVLNIIPRAFFPDKPLWLWGNIYAHDLGILAGDDESTGISFTPYADGYHAAQWTGVTLYLGLFIFVMFFVCDSVGGSIARSPWGLTYLLYFSHAASEGMLAMPTYAISNLTASLVATVLVCKYIAPIVGGFIVPVSRAPQVSSLQPYNHSSI